MFSANELPSIRMVDNAIRRRLMIWPFDHQPAKVDAQLIDQARNTRTLSGCCPVANSRIEKVRPHT